MDDAQDIGAKQDDAQLNVLQLDVGGMHCINCALLVEQRLEELPQLRRVSVDYTTGRAAVGHSGKLDIADLQRAVADDGYTLSISDGTRQLGVVGAKHARATISKSQQRLPFSPVWCWPCSNSRCFRAASRSPIR